MKSEVRRKISLLAFPVLLFFLFNLHLPNILFFAEAETVTVTATVGEEASPAAPTLPMTGSGGILANLQNANDTDIPKTSVRLSGEAYPHSTVTILKNGSVVTMVKAGSDGIFSATLEEKYSSTILYGVFAADVMGRKSSIINYPTVVSEGYLTHLSGIRFPPTTALDKIEVRVGDYLTVEGNALPKSELQVVIEDKEKQTTVFTLNSRDTGMYNITLPLVELKRGEYSVRVKYLDEKRASSVAHFSVGEENIKSEDGSFDILGDLNRDGGVNATDFLLMVFWYKKDNPKKYVDVNHDGVVNLVDFSILAFYWTN